MQPCLHHDSVVLGHLPPGQEKFVRMTYTLTNSCGQHGGLDYESFLSFSHDG